MPRESRYTLLKMKEAHNVGHTGVSATVIKFRTVGWWTVQARRMAKSLKEKCVRCKLLDLVPLGKSMGKRETEITSPAA